VLIRAFDARDAEAVAAMVAALNAEEGYNRATAADAAALRDAFLGPHALGALLVAGDPPQGYATLHPSFETEFAARGAYMGDLYVAPTARRQGAGRALVAAAARHAREAWGGEFLWWTALPKNAGGLAFYAALGAKGEAVRAFALTRAAFARLAASA
jgi:ribosomal protein S18 acetylase RimI-like enzyme